MMESGTFIIVDLLSWVTESLLDLLDELDVVATFFILGMSLAECEKKRKIAKRMALKHTIGSHSWSHRNFLTLSDAEILSELRDTSEIIRKVTNVSPKYFRPPEG
jgi:peptidoglycan/xylan/chitin deacetylase (PgdA/CDA1 family)